MRDSYEPSGFFVLRTPLLSISAITGLAADLPSQSGKRLPPDDEDVLHDEDMRALRHRVLKIYERPDVTEALFLASPSLEERLQNMRRQETVGDGDVVVALARYLYRMAGRCTPFGLFAAVSTGAIGRSTQLRLTSAEGARRTTRLDMEYVTALTDDLATQEATIEDVRFEPNSTVYELGGWIRYFEWTIQDGNRSYYLAQARSDPQIKGVLARARTGASAAELATSLVQSTVSYAQALEYIVSLVEARVLVPCISPRMTGDTSLGAVIADLGSVAPSHVLKTLEATKGALLAMDQHGVGVAPEAYRTVAKRLSTLPGAADISRLFQVDLVRSSGHYAPRAIDCQRLISCARGTPLDLWRRTP